MKNKKFAKMVGASKNEKFTLPRNIKSHKQLLPNGTWSYVFRHDELGELGRILIVPHGTQSRICCEVAGDPNDPLTEKRRAIFEPIGRKLADKMGFICGVGKGDASAPYVSPRNDHLVKSMVYPCDTCKAVTAMLVFANEADDQARLEDYARMMYPKIKEMNVPTWIVGRETANIANGKDLRKSLVLKIHPEREEAKITTPDDLMDMIDKLKEIHCKKRN